MTSGRSHRERMLARLPVLPQMAKARLSWRLILWVFLSIVFIEILILVPAAFRREREKLLELQQQCALVLRAIAQTSDPQISKQRLLLAFEQGKQADVVRGGSLYDADTTAYRYEFGDSPTFSFQKAQSAHGYLYQKGPNGRWYDVAWQPPELDGDFLVLRLDGSPVNQYLRQYVRNIILLVLLISIFVTTGTMVALCPIVIAPILRLRQDLLLAGDLISQDVSPESDHFLSRPQSDELGDVILAFRQMLTRIGNAFQERKQAEQDLAFANATLEQRVEDRTQALQATLQTLQETQMQLVQSEKMSSLGQMVAGVAHEINNPINFIQGNVSYLKAYFADLQDLLEKYQKTYGADPALKAEIERIDLEFLLSDTPKILTSINHGSQRIQEIVHSLRNFSRLDESEQKLADIHEGIDSTLMCFNERLKNQVEVVKNYGDIPAIHCYPAQLNQVFAHVINNAIDAMEPERCQVRKLTVTTALVKQHIQISFRDTGIGISETIKTKIFDPFFSTKPVGQGTGLGLGICYQIIKKHAGTIDVFSKVDQGTEIRISLCA